jgi:ribosomal protein S18 acetylase RimI-like enzyme
MLVTTNYRVKPEDSAENRVMEIRTASTMDRADVVSLWEACDLTRPWNHPVADFDRAAAGPASTVLVGLIGGELVASAMVGEDGHRGWVYYLAVRPALQGQGIGASLMRACEGWLRGRGIPKVQLMVRDTNERVLGFYAAIGYERQPVQVLGRWLDRDAER